MRRPRGASILEVLLALLILFLATLYLLSLFASGQSFTLRGREYSATTFLAQNRMEELLAAPADVLAASTGTFPSPHEDYRYEIRISDYEGDLKLVEVIVTSPRGARSRLQTLRRVDTFFGIACDPAAETVVFAQPGKVQVQLLAEGGSPGDGPGLPAGATAPQPGAVAGYPNLGLLWAVDQNNGNLTYFPAEGNAETLTPPSALGQDRPRFAGAATDAAANRLFLADRANRGLWIVNDSEAFGGRGWDGRSPMAPEDPPLGTPSGVGVDAAGSVVWVADTENQCLRMLRLSAPTLTAGYEQEPGVGWWSRTQFKPPDGMGAPQGVAVNPWSSTVFTVDAANLVRLDFVPRTGGGYAEAWTLTALPEDLAAARPSGLCFDPYRNVVYLNTRAGQVWKHTLAAPGTFLRLAGGT